MYDDSTSQKIQLYIACRNLKDLDYFSKSDPYVKVQFRRDHNAKSMISLGRTETVNNNLNPNFSKTFTIDYIFQSRQDIKFEVFDDDNGNDDYIGSVQTTVGALVGARNQTCILQLRNNSSKNQQGKIIIRCQKLQQTNQWYHMELKAKKLMNTDSFFDFWDKSDPYLRFLKIKQDNTLLEVHRTQVIKDNLNPKWKSIDIASTRLHLIDKTRFKIQCWDWEESGKDQFIGQCFADVKQLSQKQMPLEMPLSNPKSKKPGTLILDQFKMFIKPSFIDYLRGGLELNLIIAIDYTGSNGSPHVPSSLHYMGPQSLNQYQNAIVSVSQILLNYDYDKRIPAFGFGAKPKFPGFNPYQANHCFPLSGNPNQIEAFGLQHLMSLYATSLKNVQLAGPTYFGPIIKQAAQYAQASKMNGSKSYQTLLIITDGQIHDMDKVVDLLVNITNLPLSIIVVGVGNADFTNMVRLDGDNGLYDSKGRKAQRDIVQFVPFRQVKMNPDLLAKQLLAQLPNQVVQYMSLIGKTPQIPKQISIDDLLGPSVNQISQKSEQKLAEMLNKVDFFSEKPQNNLDKNPYGAS